ncbi:protein ovarian tumor locus isoform X2 [Drosophila guanche]|nr:protein ovarian tumor locus isoform X2 [Drosophila guanche]XP_034135728.1 protein ovarian tumor locus isoform X2 [Drosophila guanche]XP_034135730.1 protein ovarian tumor locus isoform X2 [Drosophila guanche]
MESLLMEMVRPVTSGSRQAPDPFDQYLECHGLYRKHTARDASSLFRVIAEQMYDTQHLHYELRQECVRFMTRKRRMFDQYINGNFDKYCRELAKPKTYGTMLELRAMCLIYRRNVILYEPFNLGAGVTFNHRFVDNFRVFYTNENHFDSVFERECMASAAVCQSITFKLLYQSLFKLPDVSFAVESMLHPDNFKWDFFKAEFDHRGYMVRLRCSDGRYFPLDLPELTKCILENYKLCKFHNSRRTGSSHLSLCNGNDDGEGKVVCESGEKPPEHDLLQMCPNRYVSCVRQLLDDGITPFPYKVAKSLDPDMYRNVEFDVWNDIRKETKRHSVYNNDYNFKVGAKCLVEFRVQNQACHYTAYIQSINIRKNECVVFVEKFGRKILAPYDTLHPVAPEDFHPWQMPYRHHMHQHQQQQQQRQMQRDHMTKYFNKNKLQKWKKSKQMDPSTYLQPHPEIQPQPRLLRHSQHSRPREDSMDRAYKSMLAIINLEPEQEKEQTQTQTQDQEQEQQQQQKSLPLKSETRERDERVLKWRQTTSNKSQKPSATGKLSATATEGALGATHFVNFMPLMGVGGGQVPPPLPAWAGSGLAVPEEAYRFPMPPPPPSMLPFAGYAPTPPGSIALHPQLPFMPLPPPPQPNRAAPSLHTPHPFEGQPRRSFMSRGDMPPDMETLRYFYNMGVDMHLRMSTVGMESELNAGGLEEQLGSLNVTPPLTPDAGEQDKVNPFGSKRGPKLRGKHPEQLKDLNDKLSQAVSLLPTPTATPSPSASGGRAFSFFSSSPGGLPLSPTHLVTPSGPPIFFQPGLPQLTTLPRGGTGGQNHYAWPLSPTMVPAAAAPPLFEVINNFSNDVKPLHQPKKQQQAATKSSPANKQVADAYASTRHQ